MGRGRQKAKQTKVARKLKYTTFETDISKLEQELTGKSSRSPYESHDEEDDPYSKWVDGDDED